MGTRSRYVFSFLAVIAKGLVALTILKNDIIPKRGEGLQITCLTSPNTFTNGQIVRWDYPSRSTATVCYANGYLCTGSNMNYNFTADNNGVYATIYSLDRLRDSGTWTCIVSDNLGNKSTVIDIYKSTKLSTTAFANEEYPATNTSPVPASITAAPASEAVTDVFQANSTRAGQFLMVSGPVQQGHKPTRKEYGAVVLQVQEDDLEMRYLHWKIVKYYFPDTEDDAWIVRADIVGHLDIAQMASTVFR